MDVQVRLPGSLPPQCLIQIGDQIVNRLHTNRQAYKVRRDTSSKLLIGRQLGMRGAGGMDNQRFRITNIGQVREEFNMANQLLTSLQTTFDAEAENGTITMRMILRSHLI